jgi:flagellar biogenesis protein FliO
MARRVATKATTSQVAVLRNVVTRLSVPRVSGRRALSVALLGGLALVAFVGAMAPLPAAGSDPNPTAAATSAPSGATIVGSVWGSAPGAGFDMFDLLTKSVIVMALLFITLRVLGRMQAAGPKRGSRLEVLESRPLVGKASLHLVAVGDRRLVVGLTSSGMVALAELDAAELDAAGADQTDAAELASDVDPAAAAATTTRPGRPLGGSARPFGTSGGLIPANSTLATVIRPIDSFADRLATLLGGRSL